MNFFRKQSNVTAIDKPFTQNNLQTILQNIEGQISAEEMFFLYQLAKKTSLDTTIVEIGAFRGKSTLCLALGSYHGNKIPIYSIDPHETFIGVMGGKFGPGDAQALYKNLADFPIGNLVFVVCLYSEQVAQIWNKQIGLLWIDGDHKYQSVINDFKGFQPFLTKNSLIAFHDNDYADVAKAIADLSLTDIDIIETFHTITLAKLKQ